MFDALSIKIVQWQWMGKTETTGKFHIIRYGSSAFEKKKRIASVYQSTFYIKRVANERLTN